MNEPAFKTRPAQPYVGKRVVMAMSELEERVPALMHEVAEWMRTHGLSPSGPCFLRYMVIDMPDQIDVEVVFPLDELPDIDGPVLRGTLPAGRYAEVSFTGVVNGIQANKRLIEWIDEQGEEMDCKRTDDGEAFTGRIETLLTDPEAEPDQAKWQIQVAIKIFSN
jgi:effector-binding domain-containing protein